MGGTVGNHLRSTIERGNQSGNREVYKDAHQFRHADRTQDTEPGTFFGPVILSGSQILADEGGECHGKTGDGQEAETFYLGVGAASGHSHFTEFIDMGLYDYIGQCDDGILESSGQSVRDNLFQHRQVETNLFQIDPIVLRTLTGEAEETQEGAEKLGKNCGNSSGTDTQTQYSHKQKVQKDVDDRGYHQID